MKRITYLSFFLCCLIALPTYSNGQLLKRIKKEVKRHVENGIVDEAGEATDKAMDKSKDAVGNAIHTSNQPADHSNADQNDQKNSNDNAMASMAATSPAGATSTAPAPGIASYKNYDFVPGEKVIFQTDFSDQQDAELPARLGTLSGTAEIQTYKDEKVLHLEKGNGVILIPMMDSANYLPGQFTVEFDMMYNTPNPKEFNSFDVHFYKPDKTQKDLQFNLGDYHFHLYEADLIDFGPSITGKNLSDAVINDLKVPNKWHHFAIYVHNNIGKVYIDQYRVAASNLMPKGVSKLAIKTDGRVEYMIKNIRIAGGGSDAYHKIMTEGKLVTHGIHFETGKADILPESMGTINEVYKILSNHPDLKLEIDGYTDNVGKADMNLKLSQQRADAVKEQLAGLGIDTARLTTKGFGDKNPVDTNSTPEGKANNRRVEFVKK